MAEQKSVWTHLKEAWHSYWALGAKVKIASGITVGILVLVVLAGAAPNSRDSSRKASTTDSAEGAEEVDATAQPKATTTPKATNTPKPTDTPKPPTSTPTATASPLPPTPTPTPIALSGSGQGATSAVNIPSGVWVARLNHVGSSNFIVKAFNSKGTSELLVNEIGRYSGSRPVIGPETYIFDVDANGAWTITIQPIGFQVSPNISDRGDSVSGVFPHGGGPKTVAITHNGRSNFIVHLQCDKGAVLVQNEIGAVNATRVVNYPSGSALCFWEIEADGDWSLVEQ